MADFRALNKKFIQRSLTRLKGADPSSCYLQNYWKLYHNVHNSNSSPALIYNIPGFSRKAPFTLLLGGAKKANVKRRKSPSTSLLLPHQEPGVSGPKQFIFGVSEIPRETIISFVTFFLQKQFFSWNILSACPSYGKRVRFPGLIPTLVTEVKWRAATRKNKNIGMRDSPNFGVVVSVCLCLFVFCFFCLWREGHVTKNRSTPC